MAILRCEAMVVMLRMEALISSIDEPIWLTAEAWVSTFEASSLTARAMACAPSSDRSTLFDQVPDYVIEYLSLAGNGGAPVDGIAQFVDEGDAALEIFRQYLSGHSSPRAELPQPIVREFQLSDPKPAHRGIQCFVPPGQVERT